MPAAYVKPYVRRQKNDAADAEAICEALTRPNMRFVRPCYRRQLSEQQTQEGHWQNPHDCPPALA
jgi:transposase